MSWTSAQATRDRIHRTYPGVICWVSGEHGPDPVVVIQDKRTDDDPTMTVGQRNTRRSSAQAVHPGSDTAVGWWYSIPEIVDLIYL